MIRCRECVISDDIFGITIDSDGICNACRQWSKYGRLLSSFNQLGKLFCRKIDRVRGKYKYDVCIGLSGGKDSSFLAYILKNKYALRVLAITIDLGFMPNTFAKRNASKVIDSLGIDSIRVSLPQNIVQKLFFNHFSRLDGISPCYLCSHILIWWLLTKTAIENNIPMIVSGVDRGQVLGHLYSRSMRDRIYRNIAAFSKETAIEQIESSREETDITLKSLGLLPEERQMVLPENLLLLDGAMPPEHIGYFLFHPYDEEAIKRTLEIEIGWVRHVNDDIHSHFDCRLKNVVASVSERLGGNGPMIYELSHFVREGIISRKEALARIQREKEMVSSLVDPYKAVEEIFGFSKKKFERKLNKISSAYRNSDLHSSLLKGSGHKGEIEPLDLLDRLLNSKSD